jgi:hypothetical protein
MTITSYDDGCMDANLEHESEHADAGTMMRFQFQYSAVCGSLAQQTPLLPNSIFQSI